MKKIAIGADHAGFPYKQPIKDWLQAHGYDVTDYGTNSTDPADYPDFAHPVASAVAVSYTHLDVYKRQDEC